MSTKVDLIEALIFAAKSPVPLATLAEISELSPDETVELVQALQQEKALVGALLLTEVAGGYLFVTKPGFATAIRRLRNEKRPKLSRAAFEVLAIVAYRQPATRSDIDSVRGVESAGSLQYLLEKKLVAPCGRQESAGRAWLYKTTSHFLEQFGLKSLEDLPDLEEFTALEHVGSHARTLNLFERATPQEELGPG